MLKRVFQLGVLSALLVAAVAVLAAGRRSGRNAPDGFVTVDYWEKWTRDEGKQMRGIVDDFNATVGRDKHIFVRYVSTSNIDQKTLVAVAAGVPPDVAGMWDTQIVQFAALDGLTPLEDVAATHGFTAASYKKVYWDSCRYDGHLYCLVSTPMTTALIYNRRIFRENADKLRAAGVDPDRPPRTFDELDRYATALDEKGVGGRVGRAGFLPSGTWYLPFLPYHFGGGIWDATHEKFTLTDPAVVRAFTWLQGYSRRMGADATDSFKSGLGTFDSPQNPFLTGTEVMDEQGPWMANYILNNNPSMCGLKPGEKTDPREPAAVRAARCDWTAAPMPSAVPGLDNVSYAGFDMLCIPRGAKHPTEAFEFIAYVNRQDVMEKLCNLHGKNSPLANVSDDFLQHHKNPYINVWDALARDANARGVPQIPIWPEVRDELTAVTQQLVLLKAKPYPALAAAQERLQRKYDDFAAKQRARRATAGAR